MKNFKNILIIKMSSLGDILHALPTLYALRENWPEARITWAVHEQFAGLLPGKPYLDEVMVIDRKKIKSWTYLRSLHKELHAKHFDMCLDLQCIAKSAIISFLSGAKYKYGYWELREGSWLVNKALVGSHKYGHVIERYLDTVRALGGVVSEPLTFPVARSKETAEKIKARLAAEGCDGEYVVVAPGARWDMKEWPPTHFADLCRQIGMGNRMVVLIGTQEDKAKSQVIMERKGEAKILDWVGLTTMPELIELIGGASVFISADTGPLHIANALQRPLIALFGPTSAARTGPYGGKDSRYIHLLVAKGSKATVENSFDENPALMPSISVDTVWAEYQKI